MEIRGNFVLNRTHLWFLPKDGGRAFRLPAGEIGKDEQHTAVLKLLINIQLKAL